MNILFITHYTELYGANRSLLNLIDGLASYNVKPFVLIRGNGDITYELQKRDITTISYECELDFILPDLFKGFKGIERRIYLLRKNRFAAKKVFYQLAKHKIDLVYTNTSVIFTGVFLSKLLGIPHVWHLREFAELHYNLIPNVGYYIYRYMLRNTAATIFVSNCLQQYYKQNGESNSAVIYNGVASKEFMLGFKDRQILPHIEDFKFCLVGLIDENKGQLDAIKAFKILRSEYESIKLIIAGGGNRSSLENYILKHNVSNVEFLGEVKNPYSVYLNSHVSLMCSKNEAMGRVTIESMLSKIPVIGYNIAGTKELLTHNQNGLLYDGSVEDLAAKMKMLMLDQHLREVLVQNAYQFALDSFTQEAYTSQVYDVLNGVLLKSKA